MLAVCRGLKTFDDGCDPIEIGEVKRRVGPDRKPHAMRSQRNVADQLENRRALRPAGIDAMINSNLDDVKPIEIVARPIADDLTVAYAHRRV